jgi:hypothetical protein
VTLSGHKLPGPIAWVRVRGLEKRREEKCGKMIVGKGLCTVLGVGVGDSSDITGGGGEGLTASSYDMPDTSFSILFGRKPHYFLPFPSRCLYEAEKNTNGDKTASVLTLVLSWSAIQFKNSI